MKTRILTGITTTGTPHLGNYAGAIKPAIDAAKITQNDTFYFLADLHALIKAHNPMLVAQSRLEIAATWIALGLDPSISTFYRQSDIAEIPRLCWLLMCIAGKGVLNRAHAYKAAVDANVADNQDEDFGITMGLFSYPVLMAADILMFNAKYIPVGRDQIQHVEMARDFAMRFNYLFGGSEEIFVLPEALITENVGILPGIDGRKMSKSYNNTIPLFLSSPDLRKNINCITTDSRLPGEEKGIDNSLVTIFEAFAEQAHTENFKSELKKGLAWSKAKEQLFELLNTKLSEPREKYLELINRPQVLEDILQEGARKARNISKPLLQRIYEAVGLSNFSGVSYTVNVSEQKSAKKVKWITFKDTDNTFKIKLLSGNEIVFVSYGFESGKEVGKLQEKLVKNDNVLFKQHEEMFQIFINDVLFAVINSSKFQQLHTILYNTKN